MGRVDAPTIPAEMIDHSPWRDLAVEQLVRDTVPCRGTPLAIAFALDAEDGIPAGLEVGT
jgi:hypothetical protein